MKYVVIDLEATCWENQPDFQRLNSEVIEIGAVTADDNRALATHEFQEYIKPSKFPVLSEYCINLTGITQEIINRSRVAEPVYRDFNYWLNANGYTGAVMVSWGNYDFTKMRSEMNKFPSAPFPFTAHINLKECFGAYEGSRPKGLLKAIESLGWVFEGKQHSAIVDTRNTVRIFHYLREKAPHVLVQRRFD